MPDSQMGRQSNFDRESNDFYRTWDTRAVKPLLKFLRPNTKFIEPCAGAGDLIDQLQFHGHQCVYSCDIHPQRDDIVKKNAMNFTIPGMREKNVDYITNPPWRRDWLHPLIFHLSNQARTWLLYDADWFHNKLTTDGGTVPPEIRQRLALYISVGRVKWIENSKHDYSKNVAWYMFSSKWNRGYTMAYGRRG